MKWKMIYYNKNKYTRKKILFAPSWNYILIVQTNGVID